MDNQTTYGVWVKANERLPDLINGITPKEVAVRYHKHYEGKTGNHINYSGGFYSVNDNAFIVKSPLKQYLDQIPVESIEWLDELPTHPIQTKIDGLREALEVIQIGVLDPIQVAIKALETYK